MQLEWWTPYSGCNGLRDQESEVWIRVVGLPLHLWTGEILKKVGDNCGGFVALDEGTTSKTDLQCARILVKMNSNVKPASVNLLAGARSYELQIWWEIRPTVAKVYPRNSRNSGGPTDPREEDDRVARANGCVKTGRAVKHHTYRDGQSKVGIRTTLGSGDAESSLSLRQSRGTNSKVGNKNCFEIQNGVGITGRKGKPKYSLLMDSVEKINGPHLEGDVAQVFGQTQGLVRGPSYANIEERSTCPTERYFPNNLRADCKERIGEKIGMANPSCSEPQEREVSVVKEKGSQETTSTQGQGCSEENNIKKALSREESCVINDKEGSKAGDEGINFCAPEKEPPSGKSPVKIPYVAEMDDAGVKDGLPPAAIDSSGNNLKDDIQTGEKSKCPPRASGLKLACARVEDEGEDDIRAERSVKSDGKGLGNIYGTRAESSGREHRYCLESHAVKSCGSGQIFGEGRGSGIVLDPGLDSGRVLNSIPDLGLNSRATQCPDSIKRASLNGFTIHEPICFKAHFLFSHGLEPGCLSPSRSKELSQDKARTPSFWNKERANDPPLSSDEERYCPSMPLYSSTSSPCLDRTPQLVESFGHGDPDEIPQDSEDCAGSQGIALTPLAILPPSSSTRPLCRDLVAVEEREFQ